MERTVSDDRSMKFAMHQSDIDSVANGLKAAGISASRYHAGTPKEEKHSSLQQWISGENKFMVCTEALAMGIDLTCVRQVCILFSVGSADLLVQMAGRAGRDGKGGMVKLIFPFAAPESVDTDASGGSLSFF